LLEVLGKLALVIGFVALFVAAIKLGGAPLIPRGEEPAGADRSASLDPEAARTEWIDHVSAICDWERKRSKALFRVYRGSAGVPKNLELLLRAAIRMGDESKAIFNRLTPPFEYRREVRELRRHFGDERRALEGLVDAVRNLDRRQYVRHWRQLAMANARKIDALRNLGLTKCIPRPLPAKSEKSDLIV
jgi:hypothetical protein